MGLSSAQLFLAPFMDRLGPTFQFVFRGNIPDHTVQPHRIVMRNISLHQLPRLVQRQRCLRPDRLALQTLVPALYFPIALIMDSSP
jgi:hypothetical protein